MPFAASDRVLLSHSGWQKIRVIRRRALLEKPGGFFANSPKSSRRGLSDNPRDCRNRVVH